MKLNFCDEKFAQVMDEFALKSYEENQKSSISYDQVTKSMMKKVSWSLSLDFSQISDFLYIQNRSISKAEYYYDQLIKEICKDKPLDLSGAQYIDFWGCLEVLGLEPSLARFKHVKIVSGNFFEFLKTFKQELKKISFTVNFKIKSIQMMQYKSEVLNEVR